MKINTFKLLAIVLAVVAVGKSLIAANINTATRGVNIAGQVTTNIYSITTRTNYPTSGLTTNITTTLLTNITSSTVCQLDDTTLSVVITNKGAFPLFLSVVNPVWTTNAMYICPGGGTITFPRSSTFACPGVLYGVVDSNTVLFGSEQWMQ